MGPLLLLVLLVQGGRGRGGVEPTDNQPLYIRFQEFQAKPSSDKLLSKYQYREGSKVVLVSPVKKFVQYGLEQ